MKKNNMKKFTGIWFFVAFLLIATITTPIGCKSKSNIPAGEKNVEETKDTAATNAQTQNQKTSAKQIALEAAQKRSAEAAKLAESKKNEPENPNKIEIVEPDNVKYALKEIDLSGMNDAKREELFRILRSFTCPCGCKEGNLVNCRNSDVEKCGISKQMATFARDKIIEGMAEKSIMNGIETQLARIEANIKRKKEMYEKTYEIDTFDARFLGKPDALLQMIVITDFQCPYCSKMHKILEELPKLFPNDLRIIFMNLPLNMHPNAPDFAAAAEAAGNQGKFFEMASKIFEKREPYSQEKMLEYGKSLGLDTEKLLADMKSTLIIGKVEAQRAQMAKNGITGTPTIILNKKMVKKQYTVEYFKNILEEELKKLGQ